MKSKIIITLLIGLPLSAASTTFGQSQKRPQTQHVTINVGTSYRPSSFKLKKGVRANLTFIRTTERSCGEQIVFPAYGITRDLPLNEPVAVIFTPRKSGTFSFTCGMHMMRGKIIVN